MRGRLWKAWVMPATLGLGLPCGCPAADGPGGDGPGGDGPGGPKTAVEPVRRVCGLPPRDRCVTKAALLSWGNEPAGGSRRAAAPSAEGLKA